MITVIEWDKSVSKAIKPALKGLSLLAIKNEVRRGEATLLKIDNIYAVVRLEGAEFVVIAAAGAGLKIAAPEILALANQHRAKSIRYHTELNRSISGWPFKLVEVKRRLLSANEYIYRMILR